VAREGNAGERRQASRAARDSLPLGRGQLARPALGSNRRYPKATSPRLVTRCNVLGNDRR